MVLLVCHKVRRVREAAVEKSKQHVQELHETQVLLVLGLVLLDDLFLAFRLLSGLCLLGRLGFVRHDCYLLGRDNTLFKGLLNNFKPADVVEQLIYVREHLLAVIDR